MKANTIRFDGDILKEIQKAKPSTMSFSAFVKELIRHELQRQQLQKAAQTYAKMLRDNPEERAWLEAWQAADLVQPYKKKSK